MKRAALMAVAALTAAFCGCAMCQNPYDYCNAVVNAHGCPNCNFGARCGSMFCPIGATPPTSALGPTKANATPDESAEPEPAVEDDLPSYLYNPDEMDSDAF